MTTEPEWRDANPKTENLPNRGKSVIFFIVGGLALGVITVLGSVIKPIGLGIGSFAFFSGITMLMRKKQLTYKPGLILIISGFLLLLTHPRAGVIAGIASTLLIIGAVGLVLFGLFKAIKLSWEVGKLS